MASPVQIVLNPENYEEARVTNGGGGRKDFFAHRADDFHFIFWQYTQFKIGVSRSFFQNGKGANYFQRHGMPANGKIFFRPLGLCTPVFIGWHQNRAHGIFLCSKTHDEYI